MNIFLPIMLFFEKIVAFVKQMIIARFFGTTEFTDAYQIAENIISVFRGAFSNSVPIAFLTKTVYKKKDNDKNIEKFSTNVIGFFSFIIVIITILVCLASKVGVASSGFNSTLSSFLLILSPTIILGFLSGMLGAILEADKLYWPSKLASLLTSACVIVSILILFAKLDIVSIFIGEIIALSLHIVLMIIFIRKRNIRISKSIPCFDNDVKSILYTSFPLMISSSIYSINSLVDKSIAVGLETGAASVLQYARTLTLDLFPTIIVTAFSGLMVREFSEMAISANESKQNETICTFLEAMVGFLGVVAIVSIVFSNDLISIAFQRGEFNSTSVSLTNIAFIGYVLGVPLFPLREVTSRVFYGYNDTKTPFISSAIGVGINIIFSILLSRIFGLIGIAIATTFSILISGIINIIELHKKKGISFDGFAVELLKLVVPFAIVGCICVGIKSLHIPYRMISIILASIISVNVYFLSLILLKSKSLNLYRSLIKR